MRLISSIVLLLGLLSASCSSNCNSSVLASGEIDQAGGTVAVTTGAMTGTAITVPANSVTTAVTLTIEQGAPSIQPGIAILGIPALFGPDETQFNPAATIALPFAPASAPPTATAGQFTVYRRASTGVITPLTPASVDLVAGLVTVDTMSLSTYWIGVPDEFVPLDYFPLGNGDNYTFDYNAVQLVVTQTSNEPNFQGAPITKLTFTQVGLVSGLYWDVDGAGAFYDLGDFVINSSFFSDYQTILDASLLLLPAVSAIGDTYQGTTTYTGYRPFGGLVPRYTGTATNITVPVDRTSAGTSVGVFDDVILVEFTTDFFDTRPASGTSRIRMWLARDVGPVMLQFNNERVRSLTSATVGGEPVQGS